MLIVGLTGGIASGKSTCAAVFVQEGIHVIDCDVLARRVVAQGSWGWKRLRREFSGHDIFDADGAVDREKLGALIFRDAELRRRLNRATHLPILARIAQSLLLSWLRCRLVVVIDMPLLYETGGDRFTAHNTVAACRPEVQVQRLMQRDQVAEEVARARIGAQMALSEKVLRAQHVIDNSGSRDRTEEQVRRLARALKRGARWRAVLSPPGIGAALVLLKLLLP